MIKLIHNLGVIMVVFLILFMYVIFPIGIAIGIIWIIIADAGGINANSIGAILIVAFFIGIIVVIMGPYDAM